MSTEYSRLEYYLLLCYVYIISINMISIIKHFSDFFEETEHFMIKSKTFLINGELAIPTCASVID